MSQENFERKTLWVILLSFVTMMVEIIFGYITGSMALLADGIHMASHIFAIGLSWLAYVFVRKTANNNSFKINKDQLLALVAYTNGLLLLLFAISIGYESVLRFLSPVAIDFDSAVLVAVIGLVVNLVSAVLLNHDHDHGDHNIRSAYLHVLADALTSVAAIIGLLLGKYFGWLKMDSIAALLSAVVIVKWAIGLLIQSGRSLVSYQKNKQ